MKIIYLVLDAVSYKHSWLNSDKIMPNLAEKKKEFLNFHNHYSVTHNTEGNLATLLSGIFPSLTQKVGGKQSWEVNKYGYLQKIINQFNYSSSYVGISGPFTRNEKPNYKGQFNDITFYSPSTADYYVPGEKCNEIFKDKIAKNYKNNHFMILHNNDAHEPYDTPYNKVIKKKFPLLWKFLYTQKNIFYKIPRRFARLHLKPSTFVRNRETFKKFADVNLKERVRNPLGPLLSPEKYPGFYKSCWENEDLRQEFIGYMIDAHKYLDFSINQLLDFIKNNYAKDTIIFMSSDHGNLGTIPQRIIDEQGPLCEDMTHIPLSVFSFDDEIRNKLNLIGDCNEFTSHADFFETALGIIRGEYKDNGYNINLLKPTSKERFIFSELNQAKYKFGQIKMFNKNKKIEIRLKNSENIENLVLCPKEDIINNISQEDYNLYKKEKINYIKTFEHRRKIDFIYPNIFKHV